MKVLKNYILNSSYQLLIVIIPIITIPYISRVLGPEGIGLNTFTSAIAQYFILAGSIGITTYGNREIAYHQQDKAKRSQIFWEISFLRFITIFWLYWPMVSSYISKRKTSRFIFCKA
ncbi:oligosaccharide flippase family protein [Lactococcus garvieae]|uniref:oligosaccharide flippase family protein n=1 Tax=Lactococcus garvieae TaxID=1363 RepID=UPI0020C3909C|nr:oligosaccharide flippase family protein [Lactococcus garvieae]